MKKTEKKQAGTKTVKTSDAVAVYNAIKGLRIMKLEKGDMFAVLRTANALKPVAAAFEDFVKDAQERLKPEGFDSVVEKSQRFDSLTEDEKREVNRVAQAYQKDVDECVREELERDREVAGLATITDDALATIASDNDSLDVQTLVLIQQVCGE